MIRILTKVVQCDGCDKYLEFEEDDTFEDWNFNHKHWNEYLKCPNCGNDIYLKTIREV